MVLSGVLGYITGYATKFVDKIVSKVSDKAASGITSPSQKPAMPETVAKSVGATHPVTGESMSARTGPGNYGGQIRYGGKTYETGAPKETYETYMGKAAALLVPLAIGAAWLAYVFLIGKSDIPAAQLSPYSISKQLFLLSTFMIVYVIFLILFTGKRKSKKSIKKKK